MTSEQVIGLIMFFVVAFSIGCLIGLFGGRK